MALLKTQTGVCLSRRDLPIDRPPVYMDRRTFLSGTVVIVAGCTGGSGGGDTQTVEGTNTPTPTRTPTPRTSVVNQSFERTGNCDTSGDAEVTVSEKQVTIGGCIRGRNGCMQAALDSAGLTDDSSVFTVIITTIKEGGDVCSQQVVQRSYETRFGFEGPLPDKIRVVHESMGDRREVASVSAETM